MAVSFEDSASLLTDVPLEQGSAGPGVGTPGAGRPGAQALVEKWMALGMVMEFTAGPHGHFHSP